MKKKPLFNLDQTGGKSRGREGEATYYMCTLQHIPSSPAGLLSVSQATASLVKPSPVPHCAPHLPIHPKYILSLFGFPTPHPALWLWLKVEGNYVRMLDMNSLKRLEYCSGFTVEISAPACNTQRLTQVRLSPQKPASERGLGIQKPLAQHQS